MDAKNVISEQVIAGWLLILGGIIFLPAGLLFTGRAIFKWPSAQSQGYLYWERGLVMAAILVATLGYILLERLLENAGDTIFPPLGTAIILTGTILMLAAESFGLKLHEYMYAPIVVAVILAFIGQAMFGFAILRTGFLPAWVGWATVVWNLGLLIIMPIAKPQDIYFPWIHYVAPLIIGIALLGR